jgi:hypothetical protein
MIIYRPVTMNWLWVAWKMTVPVRNSCTVNMPEKCFIYAVHMPELPMRLRIFYRNPF